jgi:hypothetical protein
MEQMSSMRADFTKEGREGGGKRGGAGGRGEGEARTSTAGLRSDKKLCEMI